jgi:hypothetical protein
MSRMLRLAGVMLRETGQALQVLGHRARGGQTYLEPCKCLITHLILCQIFWLRAAAASCVFICASSCSVALVLSTCSLLCCIMSALIVVQEFYFA